MTMKLDKQMRLILLRVRRSRELNEYTGAYLAAFSPTLIVQIKLSSRCQVLFKMRSPSETRNVLWDLHFTGRGIESLPRRKLKYYDRRIELHFWT